MKKKTAVPSLTQPDLAHAGTDAERLAALKEWYVLMRNGVRRPDDAALYKEYQALLARAGAKE